MASSKKKVVTKDDLRRFMKQKQGISKVSTKKVDHPLAKYNSLNQLVCMVCNNVVKNELLWTAHIQGKQHKEKVISLKTQGPAKPPDLISSPLKRKAEEKFESSVIKKKPGSKVPASNRLPGDFFDDDKAKREATKERAKAALLAGYSSSSEDEEEEEESNVSHSQTNRNSIKDSNAASSSNNKLPSDFFDAGQAPSGTPTEESDVKKKKTMADVLPEGFFDDPKRDAKVREVEYKDKMEEEWDLFQRAMKEESHVSEVIIEEEDEQTNIERNIEEIDEQIERWREVDDLHVKKENIMKTQTDGQKKDNSDDEVDDDELDEFLDWRAKKSLKE